MTVRIGASSFVWTFPFQSDEDVDLIRRTSELGGNHFEFGGEATEHLSSRSIAEAASRLREFSMTSSVCGLFSPGRDLSSEGRDVRESGLAHLRACLDLAAAVGASVVVGAMCGAGGRNRISTRERKARVGYAVDCLSEAAEMANGFGVTLALEPLNRYENNFLNTVLQALEIVELVDKPALGVHIDLFHAAIEEENIAEAFRKAGSRLVHCHVASNTRGTPGSGSLDWQSIAQSVADIGYRGAFVIETVDPNSAVLAELAAIWRPLAETQDDLVRRGIGFIRGMLGEN